MRNTLPKALIAALPFVALFAGTSAAQTMAGSSVEQAGFARSVAVGATDVFIGEPSSNISPGVVHVYQRGTTSGTWANYAELHADGGVVGDGFGRALAADGARLVVTSSGDAPAAFVFERAENGGWSQSAMLQYDGMLDGSMFGSSVAVHGNVAVVGAPGVNENTGAVLVYMFDAATGVWSEGTTLTGSDSESGDRFGSDLATSGNTIYVGSPRHAAGSGAVYAFTWQGGAWTESAKLSGSDVGQGGFFGSAIAATGDKLYVGAPRLNMGMGGVAVYAMGDAGWSAEETIMADSTLGASFFGTSLDVAGSDLIVGVPGANERAGGAVVYQDHDGMMMPTTILPADLDSRDGFAGSLAANGDVFVAGVAGDDHGTGSARVYERRDGEWAEAAMIIGSVDNIMAVMGDQVDCLDGTASAFGCEQVDLMSFVPVEELGGERGVRLNDVWGWTDPETNHEYAIVGRIDGTSFVDITDPVNPVYKGNLPRTEGSPSSTWRDMKTYKDHVFIVADGAGEHGMQVFDLRQLRDAPEGGTTFTETAHYDRIASAHNIVINEDTGFAYTVGNSSGGETCGGGLHMINIEDPTNPEFAGCFADASTGRAGTGYSHDAMCITYNGPDTEHQGQEICVGSNETAISVADVTDKANPIALSTASYPNVGYAHQGWITEDHRYFYLNDELDELSGKTDGTRTMIWDLSDLDDPQLIREYVSTNKSSDHNLYIKGNFMYQSNYQSGLRIFDISDPANPAPVGYFDTVPYGTDDPGFGGSWSNYPFFESGVVIVTSGSEGLFVVKKRQVDI